MWRTKYRLLSRKLEKKPEKKPQIIVQNYTKYEAKRLRETTFSLKKDK